MPQSDHGCVKPHPTETDSKDSQQVPGTDLTAFQFQVLVAIAERGGAEYGLGIKDHVGQAQQEEINHGRLYPNLDELAERGLIEKSALDRRTNSYELTAEGTRVLEARLDRLSEAVDALHKETSADA